MQCTYKKRNCVNVKLYEYNLQCKIENVLENGLASNITVNLNNCDYKWN